LSFKSICKKFRLKRNRHTAAQFGLFAMVLQVLIPLSAALSVLGSDAQARNGQNLPAFYLVICTAHGTQTLDQATGQPLDGGQPGVMPWDCPACQAQTAAQGPIPTTPQLVFVARPPYCECAAPTESDRVKGLWTTGPRLARAPPRA